MKKNTIYIYIYIYLLFEFISIRLFFSLYIINSLPYLSFWFSIFELKVLSSISLSLSLHYRVTPIWPFLSSNQLCPMSLTRLNFAARKAFDAYCPSTWWCKKERAGCWMISLRNKRQPEETQMKSNDQASMREPIVWVSRDWCFSLFLYKFVTNPNMSHLLSHPPHSSNLHFLSVFSWPPVILQRFL